MDYLINGLTQKEGNILYEFYFNELKFCGCGCPENTLLFIKNLLNIIYEKTKRCDNKDYYDRHYYYYDLYQKELREVFEFENKQENNNYFSNNQDGIIQFVLYYLDEVEVIEHGTSINGAWVTKKGEQILKILNKVEDWDNFDISCFS